MYDPVRGVLMFSLQNIAGTQSGLTAKIQPTIFCVKT